MTEIETDELESPEPDLRASDHEHTIHSRGCEPPYLWQNLLSTMHFSDAIRTNDFLNGIDIVAERLLVRL
jgi:hypothetical protein